MKRNLHIAAVISLAAASIFTSCQPQNIASRFTSRYTKASVGKVQVQSSEAIELGYAMLALTNFAQTDTTIINLNSSYYAELVKKFSRFKSSKGVKQLDAQLTRNPQLLKSYVLGLYAFQIQDGRLGLKANYRIDLNKIDFKRFGPLLEKFYKATGFQDFYTQHKSMYTEMLIQANNQYSLAQVQKAVNAQGYQIVVSPLATGTTIMTVKGHSYTEGIVLAGINVETHKACPGLATVDQHRIANSNPEASN